MIHPARRAWQAHPHQAVYPIRAARYHNLMMRLLQRIFNTILLGERSWGYLRLVIVTGFIAFFTYLGSLAFEAYSVETVMLRWVNRYGALKFLPGVILQPIALILWNIRYFWVALFGFIFAFGIGARYIQEVYQLSNYLQALRYLAASIFSVAFPQIKVDQGKFEDENATTEIMRKIGGPGRLIINPGSLTLTEKFDRVGDVYPEGRHRLRRFETVREFPPDEDLDGNLLPIVADRENRIDEITLFTKDGLQITVKDIHYRYRLRRDRAFGDYRSRDPKNPNPFSKQAVKDMAYNRTVRLKPGGSEETELTPWHQLINVAVDGTITDYLRERLLDDGTAPQYPDDPRGEITKKIISSGLRARLRSMGAELVWWDIGHFSITDPRVAAQRTQTWAAKWEGEADVRLAYGDAKRIEYLERGRAEVEAEFLLEIIKTFEKIGRSDQPEKNIRGIFLAKIAQMLQGFNDRNSTSSSDDFPKPLT